MSIMAGTPSATAQTPFYSSSSPAVRMPAALTWWQRMAGADVEVDGAAAAPAAGDDELASRKSRSPPNVFPGCRWPSRGACLWGHRCGIVVGCAAQSLMHTLPNPLVLSCLGHTCAQGNRSVMCCGAHKQCEPAWPGLAAFPVQPPAHTACPARLPHLSRPSRPSCSALA